MFDSIIRWFRLKWLWADDLWFFLNRRRIKRDFQAFRAMLERHRDKKGGSE